MTRAEWEDDGRPTWDETWMDVAVAISGRSRCSASSVGAVVVSAENRIEATGYNGPPRGFKARGPCVLWCPHVCQKDDGLPSSSRCISVHAEMNALLRADASRIEGGTIYCTRVPCMSCAVSIANSGLSKVVCRKSDDDDPERVRAVFWRFAECGLEVRNG